MHALLRCGIRLTLAGALVLPSAACRGTGHLAQYEFSGRTLAATTLVPPHPEVLTGPWFVNWSADPVRNVIRAGAMIVKEAEASAIRARLDSAAARVDLSGRLTARAHERAAFHLRADRVEQDREADFLMEVLVEEYGIDAESWEAAAHFYVNARLVLSDARSGRQIWDTDISSKDRIAPVLFAPGAVRDVVSARALASQSVEEIVRTLERLADYSADRITERLREALEKVRSETSR